jgi:hypothetical protein
MFNDLVHGPGRNNEVVKVVGGIVGGVAKGLEDAGQGVAHFASEAGKALERVGQQAGKAVEDFGRRVFCGFRC